MSAEAGEAFQAVVGLIVGGIILLTIASAAPLAGSGRLEALGSFAIIAGVFLGIGVVAVVLYSILNSL